MYNVPGVVDMVWRFFHQGFQDSWHFLCCLLGICPSAGHYGSQCDYNFIGESSRTFGERFKEHLKAASPIYDHFNMSGHTKTIDNFSIVGREDLNLI